MKAGRSLADLAVEIERQAESKRDFLAASPVITMAVDEDATQEFKRLMQQERHRESVEGKPERSPIVLTIPNGNGPMRFGIRHLAHSQIAQKLAIPERYYQRMASNAPDLLAANVNHWLAVEDGKRLLRTLDGHVRAFLSERYRPLDNFDFLEVVLPIIQANHLEIVSCEITESRLYLKCVNHKLQGEIRVGEIVQAGAVFSNSEVGQGTLRIEQMTYTLRCANGAIGSSLMRKVHLGRTGGSGDGEADAWEMFSDRTRQLSDSALWHQVRDVAQTVLTDTAWFGKKLNTMKAATVEKITGDPVGAVVELQKQTRISETSKGGIMRHLIEGGDLSRWGIASAITRYAQDVESYDEATEMEHLGDTVLELPKHAWESIATAEPVKAKSA